MVLLVVVRASLATLIALPALMVTVIFIPITLSAFACRLELKDGCLRFTSLIGYEECLVTDIAYIELSAWGSGLSRCSIVLRDGRSTFRRLRSAWLTADLTRLAHTIGVPVKAPPPQ